MKSRYMVLGLGRWNQVQMELGLDRYQVQIGTRSRQVLGLDRYQVQIGTRSRQVQGLDRYQVQIGTRSRQVLSLGRWNQVQIGIQSWQMELGLDRYLVLVDGTRPRQVLGLDKYQVQIGTRYQVQEQGTCLSNDSEQEIHNFTNCC